MCLCVGTHAGGGGGRLREKKGKTEGNRRQEGAPAMSIAVSKQDSIDICQERWSHMGTSWSQTSELVLHGILALLFVVVLFFFPNQSSELHRNFTKLRACGYVMCRQKLNNTDKSWSHM